MGVVYSTVIRKAKRFNVENRAFRQIERDKPVTAPRHPSSEQYYEEVVKGTPDMKIELAKKDIQLEKYLKDVFVTSTGMTPEIKRDKSLLPQNRNPVEDDELGFWEPSQVPEGYCNLRQLLQMLTEHQGDPKQWSASALATKYKLDKNKVALILDYYKPFNVYLPTKKLDPSNSTYSPQKILENVKTILPRQGTASKENSSNLDDKKDKT